MVLLSASQSLAEVPGYLGLAATLRGRERYGWRSVAEDFDS